MIENKKPLQVINRNRSVPLHTNIEKSEYNLSEAQKWLNAWIREYKNKSDYWAW